MKNRMILCVLILSTLALGQDKRTEAQSCERIKAWVVARKDLCSEEAVTLQTLDCGDKQARAKADKLHGTCLKKKRPSKDGGTEHEET